MDRISHFQPAFVLHTRAYRDTSLLVDFFTEKEGRICAMAKGVKRKNSQFRGLLQPFIPLSIAYSGKSQLVNLTEVENLQLGLMLSGSGLLSAFYVNELMMRLLPQNDPYAELFLYYQNCLENLNADKDQQEITLRIFERRLLKALGFALQLDQTVSGKNVMADNYYQFQALHGLMDSLPPEQAKVPRVVFSGKSLLAIEQQQLEEPQVRQDAKRLMRQALAPLLGKKPIKSRELFVT